MNRPFQPIRIAEKMKKILRSVLGHAVVLPFILNVILLSVIAGRSKAVKITGRFVTKLAKIFLGIMVPSIDSPVKFDRFRERIRRNYLLCRLFYDIHITQDSPDFIQFKINNCPVCETMLKYGFSDLSSYACSGDWEIAKENKDKWLFARRQTIGTGASFCNPTYMRKITCD